MNVEEDCPYCADRTRPRVPRTKNEGCSLAFGSQKHNRKETIHETNR